MKRRDGEIDKLRALAARRGGKAQKLQTEYLAASVEERDRLLPKLIETIHEAYPGSIWMENALRDGSFLEAQFKHCLYAALARPDLSAQGKTDAAEDASMFMSAFAALGTVDPFAREAAFQLALTSLLAGLRTKPGPSGLEELRSRFGRQGGSALKRGKPWVCTAWDLWRQIAEDPALSDEAIAMEISRRWPPQGPRCPSHRTLAQYCRDWRRGKRPAPPRPG